jgi:hypothetical protein
MWAETRIVEREYTAVARQRHGEHLSAARMHTKISGITGPLLKQRGVFYAVRAEVIYQVSHESHGLIWIPWDSDPRITVLARVSSNLEVKSVSHGLRFELEQRVSCERDASR